MVSISRGEVKEEDIRRELEEHGIKTFQIHSETIEFSKRLVPQPSSELEEEIYEELVKSNPLNPSSMELRRIDVSPEDMPSRSVFEYYWYVEAPHEEREEVFTTIENIEEIYTREIERLITKCLNDGEIELDEVFNIITKED